MNIVMGVLGQSTLVCEHLITRSLASVHLRISCMSALSPNLITPQEVGELKHD